MPRIVFIWIFLFALFPALVRAQDDPLKSYADPGFAKRWSIGISFGPDFYVGDLTNNTLRFWKNTSLAGSLYTQYQITNVIGFRIQLLGAWLNGYGNTVINGSIVDRSFTGVLAEGNVNGVINFSNLLSPYKSGRRFFVYGTLGAGCSAWYTKVKGVVYNADSLSTSNPLNNFHTALVVPLGLGATCRLGDRLNVSLEWTFRFVNSDLLDQTAGGAGWDVYDYLGVGISLNLGKPRSKSAKIKDYPIPAFQYSVPVQPPVQPPPPQMTVHLITPPAPSETYDYVVQICAYDRHQYTPAWIQKHYRVPYPVRLEKEGKMERFLVGNYKDPARATEICNQLKKHGIRDAFVVAYKDGVRHHTLTP